MQDWIAASEGLYLTRSSSELMDAASVVWEDGEVVVEEVFAEALRSKSRSRACTMPLPR